VVKASDYREDARNKRVLLAEYSRKRGQISAERQILASSTETDDRLRYLRQYTNGPAYAPVTGYDVTLTGDDASTATQHVGAGATSASFGSLDTGVTYTASVVALNASGESAAGTATVSGTQLTLAADKPQVKYKKKTVLSGTLTNAETGEDLAGRTVTIEARPNDQFTWTVVGTATTAADGSYEVTVKPGMHTAYRAQYAGGGATMPSTSGPATVYVEVSVSLTVSDTTVSEGTTVLFTGKALPNLKHKPVRLERKVGGSWETVFSDELKKNSRYKFFWESDEVGSSRWRVVVPGNDDLFKGTSKIVQVVVS
jgi:hypothetical protein